MSTGRANVGCGDNMENWVLFSLVGISFQCPESLRSTMAIWKEEERENSDMEWTDIEVVYLGPPRSRF